MNKLLLLVVFVVVLSIIFLNMPFADDEPSYWGWSTHFNDPQFSLKSPNPALFPYLMHFFISPNTPIQLIHLLLIPFFVVSVVVFYFIAKRFVKHAFELSLIFLFSPTILITMNSFLLEVLMLPLILVALLFWVRGIGLKTKPLALFFGAFFLGLAILTKFVALSYLVVFIILFYYYKKTIFDKRLLYLLIPIIMFVAFGLPNYFIAQSLGGPFYLGLFLKKILSQLIFLLLVVIPFFFWVLLAKWPHKLIGPFFVSIVAVFLLIAFGQHYIGFRGMVLLVPLLLLFFGQQIELKFKNPQKIFDLVVVLTLCLGVFVGFAAIEFGEKTQVFYNTFGNQKLVFLNSGEFTYYLSNNPNWFVFDCENRKLTERVYCFDSHKLELGDIIVCPWVECEKELDRYGLEYEKIGYAKHKFKKLLVVWEKGRAGFYSMAVSWLPFNLNEHSSYNYYFYEVKGGIN